MIQCHLSSDIVILSLVRGCLIHIWMSLQSSYDVVSPELRRQDVRSRFPTLDILHKTSSTWNPETICDKLKVKEYLSMTKGQIYHYINMKRKRAILRVPSLQSLWNLESSFKIGTCSPICGRCSMQCVNKHQLISKYWNTQSEIWFYQRWAMARIFGSSQ